MAKAKTEEVEVVVKGFVGKVLASAKTDNPKNIELFQERVLRYCDRKIQENKDKLIDAETNLADAEQAVAEATLKIELGSITKIAHINDYIPHYMQQIEAANDAVTSKLSVVGKTKERISFYEKVKKLVK